MESLYEMIPMELWPDEYLPDDYTGPSAGPIKVICGGSFIDYLLKPHTACDILADACWKTGFMY